MQVRTPAGQPGLRVRQDVVPNRYEAKQAGLDRTFLTAYTGARHRHARTTAAGALFSSHGHSSNKVYSVCPGGTPPGPPAILWLLAVTDSPGREAPSGPPQPGAAKLAPLAAGGHCGLWEQWRA